MGGMKLPKMSLPLRPPESLPPEEGANWYRRRNFVIRPIVVITTISKEGILNAAIKTNFMTVSSMTRFAFYCSPEHHTYRNVLETKEFVANIPTEDIVGKILKAALITVNPCPLGVNEIEKAGLTPIPSEKVRPPRIKECVAHYECVLDWYREALIVGKTVAVSVDEGLMKGRDSKKMIFIVGDPDSYGVAGQTKRWPKVSI